MSSVWEALMRRAFGWKGSEQEIARRIEYEGRIGRTFLTLADTYEELWHMQSSISSTTTLRELRVLIKLYTISWVSISDLVAILINEAFDLGYGEQDVEFGTLLRNRHVRQSDIPKIIGKYRRAIDHEGYKKRRNDIVHRATLTDPSLDQLQSDWLYVAVRARMRAGEDLQTLEDHVQRGVAETKLTERIREFAQKRAAELAAHLEATKALLDEIGTVLVGEIGAHAA